MKKLAFLLVCLSASLASAQIVRKDGTLQDALGRAMSQAQVYVCTQPCTSTSVPPSPLATIYSDSAGDASLFPGYVVTDGLGNYNYYFSSSGAPYTEVFVWHGTIVKVLVDQDTFGGGGSGFSFACPGALNGSMVATKTTASASCDPLIGTDFNGNGFSQSWATLGAFNGFYQLKGGAADPGTSASYLMPSNAMRLLAPQTTTAPYSARLPSTPCAVGQVWNVTGVTTDGNGQEVDAYGCLTPGSGVTFQVNGVSTSSQTTINFQNSATASFSNPSAGNIQVTVSGVSSSQIANPSNPTLTVGGTPGASTVTYVIQLCEDGPVCGKHTLTSTATVTTANATLSSSPITISAYADTIYGWRCANVYRTVGGPSQGLLGCYGKSLIDNGVTPVAGSPTNTNTTVLIPTMNPTSGGCDYPSGSPQGVDGLPCTVNTLDNEFTNTAGAPADGINNYFTTAVNTGTATLAWTNGTLSFKTANSTGTNVLECLFKSLPSTTFNYTLLQYITWPFNVNSAEAGFALRESSTGKIATATVESDTVFERVLVRHWTGPTGTGLSVSGATTSTNVFVGNYLTGYNGGNLRIVGDGTKLYYRASKDGLIYQEAGNENITTAFTTAPDQFGVCVSTGIQSGAATVSDFDYIRAQ